MSTEVLEKHLKLHKNESPIEKLKKFKCLSCVAKFFTSNELRTHVNKVHTNNSVIPGTDEEITFKCHDCNENFEDAELLIEHSKTHCKYSSKKNTEKHRCYVCKKSFSNREFLRNHLKSHQTVNEKEAKRKATQNKIIYCCKICDFEANTLNTAKQHLSKRHHLKISQIFANLKYKCPECSANFEKIYEIFKHSNEHSISEISTEAPKDYICEICQKPCKNLTRYKDHIKTHDKKWPRKCSYCDKIIDKRGDYNLHMSQEHEDLKEFVCNLCGKRFFHQKNLTTHMGIHTGERKFMCDICGWKFQAQNNLVS